MGHKESSDRRSKTRTRCGSLLIGITPIASVPAADFTGPGVPLLDATTIEISETPITRRGFVMATLTAGFALAVRPVSAETLTTDQTGLTAGEIQIRTTGGHIPAYRARPGQGTALPVVLVVQEIFGVHEHI